MRLDMLLHVCEWSGSCSVYPLSEVQHRERVVTVTSRANHVVIQVIQPVCEEPEGRAVSLKTINEDRPPLTVSHTSHKRQPNLAQTVKQGAVYDNDPLAMTGRGVLRQAERSLGDVNSILLLEITQMAPSQRSLNVVHGGLRMPLPLQLLFPPAHCCDTSTRCLGATRAASG